MEKGEYYWEIITREGDKITIPPSGVEIVKRRWDAGQPIHTTHRTISAGQIKSFEKTSRLTRPNQLLLEGASQAFNEPLINEDGSIQAKWVKRRITPQEWEKYYAPSGYRRLADDEGMVVIAFKLAIHDIDSERVDYCSPQEIRKLQG